MRTVSFTRNCQVVGEGVISQLKSSMKSRSRWSLTPSMGGVLSITVEFDGPKFKAKGKDLLVVYWEKVPQQPILLGETCFKVSPVFGRRLLKPAERRGRHSFRHRPLCFQRAAIPCAKMASPPSAVPRSVRLPSALILNMSMPPLAGSKA
jgi:hypothetical protein